MSVPIIVDEWLYHNLVGEDSSVKEQLQSFSFVQKLPTTSDRHKMVILKGSPFEKKMESIKYHTNPQIRSVGTMFDAFIAKNKSVTLLLKQEEVKSSIPAHLKKMIPKDDEYIFQIYFKLKHTGIFILTTDNRWSKKLLKQGEIRVVMRDEFLARYLKD